MKELQLKNKSMRLIEKPRKYLQNDQVISINMNILQVNKSYHLIKKE